MEEYYKRRPARSSSTSSDTENGGPENNKTLSEYDRYRQSLVDNNDQDEGWNSEYWRYKKDRPADVKNDTDIVQWWQVSYFNTNFHVETNLYYRNILNSTQPFPELLSTSSPAKLPQSLAKDSSPPVSKRLKIVELPLVRIDSKNYRS